MVRETEAAEGELRGFPDRGVHDRRYAGGGIHADPGGDSMRRRTLEDRAFRWIAKMAGWLDGWAKIGHLSAKGQRWRKEATTILKAADARRKR